MEKMHLEKNKHGSIIFSAVYLLHAVFTVCVFAEMTYMLTRSTQQEQEISNLKTMLYQLRHIKINVPTPRLSAEGVNKGQGFQNITEFANKDKNAVQMQAKPEISRMRKQRASRSNCCGAKASGGIVMLSESAHVIGEGGKKEPVNTSIASPFLMTSWKKKYASRHMSYLNGFLTVGLKGYYYIYSQINYADGRTANTGYMICIDATPVITTMHSVVNSLKKHDTDYAGGVFYIDSGQRISVRTPFKQIFNYNPTKSYFGAFMVHQ